jgi:VWFA-related protein
VAVETSIPTNVLIFIDEVHLSVGSRKRAIEALKDYVSEKFGANTKATIVRFSNHFDVRVRPTGRTDRILAELDKIEYEPFVNDAQRERAHMIQLIDGVLYGDTGAPDVAGESPDTIFHRIENYAELRTSDLDRAIEALENAVELASAFTGRKVLLYVSDGLPQHPALELFEYWERARNTGAEYVSRQSTARSDMARALRFERGDAFRRLAQRAQTADVAFYSFDAGGLRGLEGRGPDTAFTRDRINTTSMHANLRSGLQFVAGETGGMYIANENDVKNVLARMSEQFSTYYSIGVKPRRGEIRITVRNRPELRIIASKRMPPRTQDDVIDQNVRTRLYTRASENPLDAVLHVGAPKIEDGRCVVPVRLHVPQPELPPDLTPQWVEVRMAMLDEEDDESSLQRFTALFRSGRVAHSMMLRVRPQRHVLSVAVSNPVSMETSYLQSDIDAASCR